MTNYQLNSNLSEKQVEADVASYFGWMSKGSPFRLLDIDEKITGADKKFYDAGFSYFMQFKTSKGLIPLSELPASNRKNMSKLEDIRIFRGSNHLDDKPILYFGLRRMAKNASDYQHNILMSYANNYASQAFYVAPLHLDKTSYYSSLFNSVARYRAHPFYERDEIMYRKNWVSHIGFIPFLKEHISIIPHELVQTHNHYYSYSETGTDLAWHSPELLSEQPTRLSDILAQSVDECIKENKFSSFKEIESSLNIEDEPYFPEESNNLHPIERIQSKARHIYKKHRIRLIILLGNREYISKSKRESLLEF